MPGEGAPAPGPRRDPVARAVSGAPTRQQRLARGRRAAARRRARGSGRRALRSSTRPRRLALRHRCAGGRSPGPGEADQGLIGPLVGGTARARCAPDERPGERSTVRGVGDAQQRPSFVIPVAWRAGVTLRARSSAMLNAGCTGARSGGGGGGLAPSPPPPPPPPPAPAPPRPPNTGGGGGG